MAFTESTKRDLRRKAHFRCCVCQSIGVEIHHIVPQGEGGLDDPDNAAPLCPSCHETYGANKEKRKFVREARNHWFELCSNRYAPSDDSFGELVEKLEGVATKRDLDEVLSALGPRRDSGEDEDLPEALQGERITASSLREYLRFMYPTVPHCGPKECASLSVDLRAIGYGTLDDLHGTLNATNIAFAEFAQAKRDSGSEMDSQSDAVPARLFLAIWDEEYSRKYHPDVVTAEKFPGYRWRRPSSNH